MLSRSAPEKFGSFDSIFKRLERVETRYSTYLSGSPCRVKMKELGADLAQVEMMLSLVQSFSCDLTDTNSVGDRELGDCEKVGREFWAAIAKWQAASYKESCIRLLEDYKERTRHISGDPDVDTITRALSKAVAIVPTAYPEKATLEDIFKIKTIYDDPELKALVESNMFTAKRRNELYEAAEDWALQQPVFPPECYALFSNRGG